MIFCARLLGSEPHHNMKPRGVQPNDSTPFEYKPKNKRVISSMTRFTSGQEGGFGEPSDLGPGLPLVRREDLASPQISDPVYLWSGRTTTTPRGRNLLRLSCRLWSELSRQWKWHTQDLVWAKNIALWVKKKTRTNLHFGFWILDFGFWILKFGF